VNKMIISFRVAELFDNYLVEKKEASMIKMKRIILVFSLLIFVFIACNQAQKNYNSLEAIAKYLSETEGGKSYDDPLPLKINIDLQNMLADDSGWKQLLRIINTQGKYVALDLTDCRMSNTEFNPDTEFKEGKKFITTLILPNITESIPETRIIDRRRMFGYDSISTFLHFENLSLIIPAKVNDIGFYSLSGNIKNVEFLVGSQLDEIWAIFGSSPDLISIKIPASVKKIDMGHCKNLKSVTFETGSKLTTIGYQAFLNSNLESIIIPENVTSIEYLAFESCTNLKNVTILAKEPPLLGKDVFTEYHFISHTSRGEIGIWKILPSLEEIRVPVGSVDAYKSDNNWSIYADLIVPLQ